MTLPIPAFIAELIAGGARVTADELASHAMTATAAKAAAKAQAGVAVAQQAYGRLFDLADEDDNRTPERQYGVIRQWTGTSGVIETAAGELAFDGPSCRGFRPTIGAKVTCTVAPGQRAGSVEPIGRR
jgi:hypothetical protein